MNAREKLIEAMVELRHTEGTSREALREAVTAEVEKFVAKLEAA